MKAVQKNYFLDHEHSAYIDQWDWEKVITEDQRNLDFLTAVVKKYGNPRNAGGRPDYIFVDHGRFTGAEIDTKSDLTLSGVWGADNTTNAQATGNNVNIIWMAWNRYCFKC